MALEKVWKIIREIMQKFEWHKYKIIAWNILGDAKKEAIKAAWEKVRAERKEERKAERQAALLNAPKVTHIHMQERDRK